MRNGHGIPAALATLALVIVLPVESGGQSPASPIVVPFERTPATYIVIRVPVAIVSDPPVSLPSGLKRTGRCDDWPNIHVEDPYTRDAATRALHGACEWLARPKCHRLLMEFKDERNRPLTAKLRELETDPVGYLRMVLFLDGAQSATCKTHGILAFTTPHSRVIYLCGRDFERAWRRDIREVQATIIHEWLHSLGVGENPPSPRAITSRILQLCW